MPSCTIQLEDEQSLLLAKYAAREGDDPAILAAKLIMHELEQAEGLEALKQRCANAPSREEFLDILAKVPDNPPLPGDEMPQEDGMKSISSALAFAMAYLGTVGRESDTDEDNDVKALEDIAAELASMTRRERQSLQNAAQTAIEVELAAKSPNHSLVSGYRDVLEHLQGITISPNT
jgi:hypothetical protein